MATIARLRGFQRLDGIVWISGLEHHLCAHAMVFLLGTDAEIELRLGVHLKEIAFSITEGLEDLDVRDSEEKWICVSLCGEELMILSPGVFHRFTLFHDLSL